MCIRDRGETQVDEIYPEYAEALHKAGLAPEVFPTFREIWEKDDGRLVGKKKNDGIQELPIL
eukprot:5609329-Ditylum_brightwellii.AAC.1